MLNEELLEAWLRLSCVIDNQRLAADFPFNEALVCGLLSQGGCRTASELCARTRILKSQMNAILRSLEASSPASAPRRTGGRWSCGCSRPVWSGTGPPTRRP